MTHSPYSRGEAKPQLVANIDTWIAALQSNQYRQTRSVLGRADEYATREDVFAAPAENCEFCCLGVFCLVTGIPMQVHKISTKITFGKRTKKEELLPPDGLRASGLRENEGSGLAELNDAGRSFVYIAERLLVDLRAGSYEFFTPFARAEWCAYYGLRP